jgi:hypothetical protein
MAPPTALAVQAASPLDRLGRAARLLPGEFAAALVASLRRQCWLIVLILAYFGAAVLVDLKVIGGIGAAVTLYSGLYFTVVPLMLLALLLGYPIYVLIVFRPKRAFAEVGRRMRTELLTVDRVANALPLLVIMPAYFNSFTLIKSALPTISPYRWDAALEAADRWLHGGVAPWRLLQPLLGEPAITYTVNFGYVLWFFVVWLVIVWQVFNNRDQRTRARFFGTMMLSWILIGGIGAYLFSSAGPCYFGRVTGLPDPYAPLMAYLQETAMHTKVFALTAQEMLWSYYTNGNVGLGGGISAMPSMHVAMAVLIFLVARRVHWSLGILGFLYVIVIQVGSVHLGWHYAIDGYVAGAATVAIWWAVGRVIDWRERLAQRADPAQARPIEG